MWPLRTQAQLIPVYSITFTQLSVVSSSKQDLWTEFLARSISFSEGYCTRVDSCYTSFLFFNKRFKKYVHTYYAFRTVWPLLKFASYFYFCYNYFYNIYALINHLKIMIKYSYYKQDIYIRSSMYTLNYWWYILIIYYCIDIAFSVTLAR